MLYSCILFYSLMAGIDPQVVQTVIQMESSGNPYALGSAGDSGLMQIRHKYVPETQLQLFSPCTNVRRGVQLLKKAKENCVHKKDRQWLICYNLGISGGRKIRFPHKQSYWIKFKKMSVKKTTKQKARKHD